MEKLPDHLDLLRTRQMQANKVFKPLFYRLHDKSSKEAFNELLNSPGLLLTDPISDQMKELIRFKNPGVRFSTNDLELETKNLLDGRTPEEFGVWVYYPWSNRLVHCLDEEDFINIRTSRNQYKITREERDVLAWKKIGVVGLSVGQSVSVTIAMERLCGELRLADFDTLELNNLNRIRTGIHNLGLPKVYSVAREIAEIDPFLNVTCFTDGLTENNMEAFFTEGGKLDLLIEESDGFDIKILSRYKARELKIPVLMEASDRCMVDVERFDLEPERSILHGIVDHLDVAKLKSLQTSEEKIPYMLDVLGIETSSLRLKASMVEMNQTINTWPQLASAVTMGGGITADVARRLLLDQYTESGRYHVDIEEIIGNKKNKTTAVSAIPTEAPDPAVMRVLCGGYETSAVSEASEEQLEKIVEAAVMAPSHFNRQPWRWAAYQQKLFLFRNGSPVSALDPMQTGTNTALGAAIENAVLKAEELGLETDTGLLAGNGASTLVAVMSFKKKNLPAPAVGLSAFIALRSTNRKAGTGKPISEPLISELNALAMPGAGAEISLITDREKIMTLAKTVGMVERICLLQPELNKEYFSEVRWKDSEPAPDGIDIRTMELPVLAETAFKVISDSRVSNLLYAWEKGVAFKKMTEQLVGSSSAIGLVSLRGLDAAAGIRAGRLVQKAWLTATKNNLGFQPICLPLYLLEQMSRGDKSGSFSTKVISELAYVKKQFLQVFPVLNSNEGVFLFRLSESGAPSVKSLRKPIKEVYFKL